MYVCIYIYISIIYIYMYIYIYIYYISYTTRARRSWADADASSRGICTPSPPTKSLGFSGFDSSRLLILRGGNSHVR